MLTPMANMFAELWAALSTWMSRAKESDEDSVTHSRTGVRCAMGGAWEGHAGCAWYALQFRLKCPRESGQLKICPPSSYPSSHEPLVARGLVPYKEPLLFDAAPPAGAYPASGANMAVWLHGMS